MRSRLPATEANPLIYRHWAPWTLPLLDALRQSGNVSTERFCGPYLRGRLPFSASVPFLPMQLIQDYFPLLTAKLDIQVIKILIDDNLERNLERVKMIRDAGGPG